MQMSIEKGTAEDNQTDVKEVYKGEMEKGRTGRVGGVTTFIDFVRRLVRLAHEVFLSGGRLR